MISKDLRHDADWLAAFRRGDQQAVARMVETYTPMLEARLARGFTTVSAGSRIRLKVHDPDERHELVQETFARTLSAPARERYSGESDYGAYLLRTCRNLAIDRFRRACTERDVVAPGASEALERAAMLEGEGANAPAGGSPEKAAARTQFVGHLRDFIAELSGAELQLMLLYAEGEVSQRQAADALGIERHQVRSLLASLRDRLLRFMKRRRVIDSIDPEQLLELVTASCVVFAMVMS